MSELEEASALQQFWEDNTRAQRVLKMKGGLERVIRDWASLEAVSYTHLRAHET